MYFGKSTIVGAILYFFSVRVILYSPESAKRNNWRLTSLQEAIIENHRIKTSRLLKDLALKLVRLKVLVDLAPDDCLCTLLSVHDLLFIILTLRRKIVDLTFKLSLHDFGSI